MRDHLAHLVAREDRRRAAAERLKRAMREQLSRARPPHWTREDLYERMRRRPWSMPTPLAVEAPRTSGAGGCGKCRRPDGWILSTDELSSSHLLGSPRLWHGEEAERSNFEIFGDGAFIHWPDLDEDLSVASLVGGLHSGESPESLKKWLDERRAENTPSA